MHRKLLKPVTTTIAMLVCALLSTTAIAVTAQKLYERSEPQQTRTTPWLRLSGDAHHLKLSKTGRFLAFTDANGHNLSVLDTKTKKTYPVSRHKVGPGAFWGPDGWRLFFRSLSKTPEGQITSKLQAYDMGRHQSVALEISKAVTGFPMFDQQAMRLSMMTPKGVINKTLLLPGERLANWQVAQRNDRGSWLVTDQAVLWLTDGGYTLDKVSTTKSTIQSFHVSKDGQWIAWADTNGRIYQSKNGKPAKLVAKGKDPQWHPVQPLLAFSKSRFVGHTVSGYDLAIVNQLGDSKSLTRTDLINERWPTWSPDGKSLIFAADQSTDLMRIDFESPWK